MEDRIKLEETLVTLSFVQSRCYALRNEVETQRATINELRQELETYKMQETQGVDDGGR